jgi:hypothetical protein
MKRALRLDPDSPEIMIELARRLSEAGERLRASELLQSALRRLSLDLKFEPSFEAGREVRLQTSVREHEESRQLAAGAHLELAQLLALQDVSSAEVLLHLGEIETRSNAGIAARLMEAELHQREGHPERRNRSLSRLLEAIELGWVTIQEERERLKELLKVAGEEGVDPSLLAFADRVLENSDSPKAGDGDLHSDEPLS